MRLLSAMLFLSLSGLGGQVAFADDVKPAETKPEASNHKIPLRIVKMLPDTQQALLYDSSQGTHVVADSGATISGLLVDSIDEDSVTLIAEDGTEIVLAAPPKKKKKGAKASEPGTPTVTAAAPADPYGDAPTTAAPSAPNAAPAPAEPHAPPTAAPTASASATPPAATSAPPAVASAPAPAPADPYAPPAAVTTAPTASAPATAPAVPAAPPASSGAPTATPAPPAGSGSAPAAPATSVRATSMVATPPVSIEAGSASPDTSELDPGIAAFVEAVGAVPAPEAITTAAPTAPSAASSSKPLSATPIVAALRRSEVDAALGDFGALSASFRATFTPTGLRIDSVVPGSLLAKAGFTVGDVITIVDGKPLRTIDDAADLYARAWTTSMSTVQVIRAKQPLTVRIAIQ